MCQILLLSLYTYVIQVPRDSAVTQRIYCLTYLQFDYLCSGSWPKSIDVQCGIRSYRWENMLKINKRTCTTIPHFRVCAEHCKSISFIWQQGLKSFQSCFTSWTLRTSQIPNLLFLCLFFLSSRDPKNGALFCYVSGSALCACRDVQCSKSLPTSG